MINTFPYNEEMLRSENNIYYDKVEISYESKYDLEFNVPEKLYKDPNHEKVYYIPKENINIFDKEKKVD